MPIKPVVFIPGFPASELLLRSGQKTRKLFLPEIGELLDPVKKREIIRRLVGPDDPPGSVVAGEPIRSLLQLGPLEIARRAQALYDLLRNSYGYTIHSGNNFRAVGWDWRRAVDARVVHDDVVARIQELADANGGAKVVLLVHSTGGLVLRSLLERRPEVAGRIAEIVSLGVPWAGTLAAVRVVALGQKIGFGPASFEAREVQQVMSHAQAGYDLFPPDPARTRMFDPFNKALDLFVDGSQPSAPQVGPLVDLRWVPQGPAFQHMPALAANADQRLGARTSTIQLAGGTPHPPITNVVGWGVQMDTTCVMDAKGKLKFQHSKEGDGTAPANSASWLRGERVRTLFVPVGIYPTNGIPFKHSLIWDSPPVKQLFDEVLLDRPRSPYVCGSVDAGEAITPGSDVTLRLAAADEKGQPLPDARFRIRELKTKPRPFGNRTRLEVVVKNADLHPDQHRIVRFVVEITWGTAGPEQTREVVILFKR